MADFKSGVETIFVSNDNKQEYIEVDDSVRQGEYKYTYADNSLTAMKSEQADLVVSAVERFAQMIPLNLQEIFVWYFEQKGVDNQERFLGVGVNGNQWVNKQTSPSPLAGEGRGEGLYQNMNPENQLSQDISQQNTPNLPLSQNYDMNTLALLLGIMQQINKEKGEKAKPEDFIKVLENILEQEKNNEI